MMVDAHKRFNVAMGDSKKVVRRFFLVLFLSIATGLALGGSTSSSGLWKKIMILCKNLVTGD